MADNFDTAVVPSGIVRSDIDWQAIIPQAANEGGTVAYGTKVGITKQFEVRGGYKVGPIVNGKLGDVTNTETTGAKTAQGPNVYGGGQAVGMIMTPSRVEDMGTLKMGQDSKGNYLATLNLSDGIEGVANALIAGRDLYYARTADVDPLLVRIRQTNGYGALYGDTKVINGSTGQKDIFGNAVTTDGKTAGYAKASEAKNGVDGTNLSKTYNDANYSNSSNKTTAFTDYLSKGVYFDYFWNPVTENGKVKTVDIKGVDGQTHTYVYANLTYSEYSNFAAISGTPTQADKDKYLLSTVSGTGLVQTQMALGLFGGSGQSYFGGISYFQAANVTNDIQVNYQFKKNPTSLLQTNTVTALAGETVQINGGKDTVAATDGHYVSNYDAPEIKGFKIDSSSKLSAVAGTGKTLTVIYTTNQDDFDAQVTTAQHAKDSIDASIMTAQDALKNAKTDQDKSDINEAFKQLQGMSDKVQDIIDQLKKDTDATKISGLSTVKDVTSTLTSVEKNAASATAMADDATKLTDAVTSFSDANTTDQDEDIAHTRAELEGQTTSNSVTAEIETKVQEAKKALDAVIADKTSMTADIVYKRSVLLADMAADEQASNDDVAVAVAAATKRLNDLVDGGMDKASATDLDDARAALATAVPNVVNKNVLDDDDVLKARTDYATDLATGKDTTDSLKALQGAVANANTALQEAETKAKNDAVPSNLLDQINSEASSSLAAIVTKTNSMGADSTYTKSQLVDQMSILSSALSGFSAARTEKSTAADSVLSALGTSSLAGDLSNAVSALRSTLSDSAATKTEIENRTAVVNADSLLYSLANPDMKTTSMSSYVSSIASYVSSMASASNVTSSALSTAASALKSVADTPVSSVVEDNTAVKSAESAFASDLIAGKDIASASSALSVAVSTANTELTAAKKSAVSYAIPSNIVDQTKSDPAVNSELAKVQSMSADSIYTKSALDSEMAVLSDSLSHFTSALSSMKSTASVAVVDSNLTDQEDASMASIVTKLNSLGAQSNGVKVADMSSALSAYNSAVASYKTVLSDAKSVASVTASKTTGNEIVNSMASILVSVAANSAATSSMVASASTALKLATSTVVASDIIDDTAVKSAETAYVSALKSGAKTPDELATVNKALSAATSAATSTSVAANVADDDAVMSAESAYVSALNSGAVTSDALSSVATALDSAKSAAATALATKVGEDATTLKQIKHDQDIIDGILSGLKTKLNDAKTSAKGDAAAWDEVSSLYADQTDETSAIQKDIDTLNGLTTNDKATKKQIDDARKQLQDDIDVVKGVRNDAVTDGKNTADANKNNGDDEVQTTVGKLNNALDNGTASDIKTAIENVKTAVDTVVVPNISDSDDVADAKKAVNDALNADKLDKVAGQNAVDNFNTAVAKAQKNLADTKDGAANDEKSWTADAPKYADQITTTIQNDIDHLNELTSFWPLVVDQLSMHLR